MRLPSLTKGGRACYEAPASAIVIAGLSRNCLEKPVDKLRAETGSSAHWIAAAWISAAAATERRTLGEALRADIKEAGQFDSIGRLGR
jgi:hypothetical protein